MVIGTSQSMRMPSRTSLRNWWVPAGCVRAASTVAGFPIESSPPCAADVADQPSAPSRSGK
jgi:hypothetical protein